MIAPARTGSDRRRRMAVIRIAQTRRGVFSIVKFLCCILMIVEIKLMAPKMDETPAI